MARPETIGQPLEAIEAMLHYLEEGSEKPASYGGIRQTVADQQRKGNYLEHKMTIYNARAIADRLSLEREGFIFVNHETRMNNFYDEAEVRELYYRETEELVKKTSGAKRVVVFDHTLRSADPATREEKQISGPVRNAHNDYTDWSGPQRVRDLLPDEAEELAQTPLCHRPNLAAHQQACAARTAGDRRCAQHRNEGNGHHREDLPGSGRRNRSHDFQSRPCLVLFPQHAAQRSDRIQDFRFGQRRARPMDRALRVR